MKCVDDKEYSRGSARSHADSESVREGFDAEETQPIDVGGDELPRVGRLLEAAASQPIDVGGGELPRVGSLLEGGRYRLRHRIGAGSMGVVFAAHDTLLGREVAVKFLTDTADRPAREAETRLLGEARAMAALSTHENVVMVYDVGWVGDQMFILMERVCGEPLTEWCKSAPRPWQILVELLRQAVRGLNEIHERGLIHGDIKPDNMIVALDERRAPPGWQLKIADFGLSYCHDRSEDGEHLLGSIDYMAPEQLVPPRQPASTATDVYACALVFYEAIYGRRPFVQDDDNLLQRGLRALPAELRRRAPEWVYRALMKGLSPDPDMRYPCARAFLQALEPSPTSRRQTHLPCRKRRSKSAPISPRRRASTAPAVIRVKRRPRRRQVVRGRGRRAARAARVRRRP